MSEPQVAKTNERLQTFFLQRSVNKRQPFALQTIVKDNAADSCVNDPVNLTSGCPHHVLRSVFLCQINQFAAQTKFDLGLSFNRFRIERENHVINRIENFIFALHSVA